MRTDLGDEPDSPRALRSNPTGGGDHKDAAKPRPQGPDHLPPAEPPCICRTFLPDEQRGRAACTWSSVSSFFCVWRLQARAQKRSVPGIMTARWRRVAGVDLLRVPAALHDGTRQHGGEVGLELPLGAGRILRPWRWLPAGEAPGRGARLTVDLFQLRARGSSMWVSWRGVGSGIGEA